ncbi:MAG TPA: hypothetical protein VKB36_22595, partial [Vicinamibacterales bacterium]|nr:hypothetical protein [Vicinamibacterales bacterium]
VIRGRRRSRCQRCTRLRTMSVGEVTVPPFVVSNVTLTFPGSAQCFTQVFADSTIDVPLSNS